MIKSKVYELNQMFNLKFYEEENQSGATVRHNFQDMSLTDDMEKAISIVRSGKFNKFLDKNLIPSF